MAGTALTSSSAPGKAVPNETTPAVATLYLDIELKNGVTTPMTAVYVPDAAAASGAVDLLVYLHGHKGELNGVTLTGMTVQQYISHPKLPELALRGFVQKSGKKNFLLVVPTLGNKSEPGDLTANGANIDGFLNLVLKGVEAHLPVAGPLKLGNLVLAGHSGAYIAMQAFANNANADKQNKIHDIFCLDCLYGGASSWVKWVQSPGHEQDRLWVFSTGSSIVTRLTDKTKPFDKVTNPRVPVLRDESKPYDPVTNPYKRSGTGDETHVITEHAKKLKKAGKTSNIKVYISNTGEDFDWTFAHASDHNKSIGQLLPKMIADCPTLK